MEDLDEEEVQTTVENSGHINVILSVPNEKDGDTDEDSDSEDAPVTDPTHFGRGRLSGFAKTKGVSFGHASDFDEDKRVKRPRSDFSPWIKDEELCLFLRYLRGSLIFAASIRGI